jgi:hypothetical protein
MQIPEKKLNVKHIYIFYQTKTLVFLTTKVSETENLFIRLLTKKENPEKKEKRQKMRKKIEKKILLRSRQTNNPSVEV